MSGIEGFFSYENAKRIWRAVLAWERWSMQSGSTFSPPTPAPIYFKNNSGEEIPAYSIMQATGTEENGEQNYIIVDKPISWTSALVGPFFFNGPTAVPDGEFGTAQNGPVYRCIGDGTTFSIGMRIGPVNASWEVGKGCMYSYIGNDDVATDCIRVISNETPLLGTTDGSGIASGGSGTVTVRVPSATTWSAGTVTYTAWNDAATSIGASARVMIFPIDAKWVAVELC